MYAHFYYDNKTFSLKNREGLVPRKHETVRLVLPPGFTCDEKEGNIYDTHGISLTLTTGYGDNDMPYPELVAYDNHLNIYKRYHIGYEMSPITMTFFIDKKPVKKIVKDMIFYTLSGQYTRDANNAASESKK